MRRIDNHRKDMASSIGCRDPELPIGTVTKGLNRTTVVLCKTGLAYVSVAFPDCLILECIYRCLYLGKVGD
ncbi:hypothetical protein GDO86_002077 [Hymenochirus boettgeri]|uniref:Uncharacterized protein n=1 Tax=Hymenochirus boettgeri TaxID=247094 RepID=A0A8T2KL21_9PIPI|nr:hypothetical protein GDO86_002077 [Hymenochirus boettgeri]